METVHLFYSWQSDRESKLCRDFIWYALGEAATAIRSTAGVELRLDRDTAGVAGTPPVTDTILEKIRACDIFFGDMTFVGGADGANGKLLPNPNVMAEYGFARAIKDHTRLQLVMNAAFGPPSELPFDMRAMRHPTTYNVGPQTADGARRAERRRFATALIPFLTASIEAVLADRRVAEPAEDKVEQAKSVLADLDALTHRGDSPAIVSNPRLRVRMVPIAAVSESDFDLTLLKQLRPKFVPSGFAPEYRKDYTDGWQWASFDPPRRIEDLPNPEARWLVRIVSPGAFEAAITIGFREGDDPTLVVRGHQLETRIVSSVETLTGLAGALGLAGRAVLAVSMHGVSDLQVGGSRTTGRAIGYPDVTLGSVTVVNTDQLPPRLLKSMMDKLWLLSGWEEGSPSFSGGEWAGSAGGEIYRL